MATRIPFPHEQYGSSTYIYIYIYTLYIHSLHLICTYITFNLYIHIFDVYYIYYSYVYIYYSYVYIYHNMVLIKSFKTTDIDYLVILYIQSSRHNLRCFLSMLDLPILQVLGYGDEIIKKTGSNIHMRLEKHMRDPQNRFFTRIGIISKWPNGFFSG